MKTLKERTSSTGRWVGFTPANGTLRELKASAAQLKSQVTKESKVFSNYSLTDGGKKLNQA